MKTTQDILLRVPFFRHLTRQEIAALTLLGKSCVLKKGQTINLGKVRSFNCIVEGVLEIDAPGRRDIISLTPGSFFGSLPFVYREHAGVVRALTDAVFILFELELLHRFLLGRLKAFRGYARIVEKMGLPLHDTARQFRTAESAVIMTTSLSRGAGKSFFTALLGLSLAGRGKTVILDLCHNGESVCAMLKGTVPPPLAEKPTDAGGDASFIADHLRRVNDNLQLINVSFNARVRTDPAMLSPLLLILSKEFRFILVDAPSEDIPLRRSLIELTDTIFVVEKKSNELGAAYAFLDREVREGQRVYHVLNQYHTGKVRGFEGGFLLERYAIDREEGLFYSLMTLADRGVLGGVVRELQAPQRALMLQPRFLDALFFAGFFNALNDLNMQYDLLYTSSFSYIMASFFLLTGGGDAYTRVLDGFFSEKSLPWFLKTAFSRDHVYRNKAILAFTGEVAGARRIENYSFTPHAMLADNETGERRVFSAGFLRDVIADSFMVYPVFKPHPLAGAAYGSGFPQRRAQIEDLFRIDVGEITAVTVRNGEQLTYESSAVSRFFTRYLRLEDANPADEGYRTMADRVLEIEVSERKIKIKKIIELSGEISHRLLKPEQRR